MLHPGRKPISKKEMKEALAKLHKVDAKAVVVYGFETSFGGGRSSGFGLIYDSVEGAFCVGLVATCACGDK